MVVIVVALRGRKRRRAGVATNRAHTAVVQGLRLMPQDGRLRVPRLARRCGGLLRGAAERAHHAVVRRTLPDGTARRCASRAWTCSRTGVFLLAELA